jgi:hypothetical protein
MMNGRTRSTPDPFLVDGTDRRGAGPELSGERRCGFTAVTRPGECGRPLAPVIGTG